MIEIAFSQQILDSRICYLPPTFQGQCFVLDKLSLGLQVFQLEVGKVLLSDDQISQTTIRNKELKADNKQYLIAQICNKLGGWVAWIRRIHSQNWDVFSPGRLAN